MKIRENRLPRLVIADLQFCEWCAGARIPELDGLLVVFAAGGQKAAGGMPRHTLDVSAVTCAIKYTSNGGRQYTKRVDQGGTEAFAASLTTGQREIVSTPRG